MNQNLEHLRLLSIFHYVVGGLTALFACFPIFHVVFGIIMIAAPEVFGNEAPPAFMGWMMAIMGGVFMLVGWTLAVLILYAGRCLGKRRRHTYCLVVAVLSCLFMPFGTALGVFTIIVLIRPSVKDLFAPGQLPQAGQAPGTQ